MFSALPGNNFPTDVDKTLQLVGFFVVVCLFIFYTGVGGVRMGSLELITVLSM